MSNQPKVTIIITTYNSESKRYLDLCIESIKRLNYPKNKLEVIIVSRSSYLPRYENCLTIHPPEESFYPARGINFASQYMASDSEYIFTINDDVILTRDSLKNLVNLSQVMNDNVLINPISPCDNYLFYGLKFGFEKDGIFMGMPHRFYVYEDLSPYFENLVKSRSLYETGFVKAPYLCFYATLIPRKIWEKVGLFDENFKLGQDDIDYSYRARNNGVMLVCCLDSLVWHFGGEGGSKGMDQSLRDHNALYFKDKWGVLPP